MRRSALFLLFHCLPNYLRYIFLLSTATLFLFPCPGSCRIKADDLKTIYETGLIPLTDDQEGTYKAGRDYLIFETMQVKSGDTVMFSPGSRIFFHSSAKITVHGTLIFDGTKDRPITIGKLNITIPKLESGSRLIFDSTSFTIYRRASIRMQHVNIADSTINFRIIDSEGTFTMDSVRSSGNRLLLPDTLLNLWPGCMVTCSKIGQSLSNPCIPPPPFNQKKSSGNGSIKFSQFRVPIRIGLGIGVATAIGAWFFYNDKANDATEKYHNQPDPDAIARLKNINTDAILSRNLMTVAAALGTIGFTATFYLGND